MQFSIIFFFSVDILSPKKKIHSLNHLQMEVRASDIRVSERVCMSSITIDGYTTVYNELTDEVFIRSI
jgi:hypothetical protein